MKKTYDLAANTPNIKKSFFEQNSGNADNFKKPAPRNPVPASQSNESVYSIIKRYKKLKDVSVYQQKLQLLKMNPPPVKPFCQWFDQLIDCVPIINKEAENFISDLMSIPWQYGDEKVISLFRDFILSLVTSHNFFSFHILESLFKQLLPVFNEEDKETLKIHPFQLSEVQIRAHRNTIQLIVEISKHVPMCHSNLVKIARSISPYFKNHVHVHSVYVFNMLQLCELLPEFRRQLLEIIIANMIKLDLYTPKSQLDDDEDSGDDDAEEGGNIFEMEVDQDDKSTDKKFPLTTHELGHTLDMLMLLLFRYIHYVVHGGSKNTDFLQLLQQEEEFSVNGCRAGSTYTPPEAKGTFTSGCSCSRAKQDSAAAKDLYMDLKQIFLKIILPTFACSHVQFLLFYLLSIRSILLTDFLDVLRTTFESCNAVKEERKNAAAYLGSLLSRGNFVTFSHVHSCLKLLRLWCSSYLEFCGNSCEDIQKHTPFYYACQTIFYIFTFNYKKYTESRSRLKQAESLHLSELVLSSLNPLRYCLPAVAENFAIVARRYQIAYCQTILENNRRVMLPIACEDSTGTYAAQTISLDMFFPYDPYLLKRSASYIKNYYAIFEGLPEDDLDDNEDDDDDDDMHKPDDHSAESDEESRKFCLSPNSLMFSFETSPGFKR